MTGTQTTHEHYDAEANKLGMWIFLFTEFMLFGGLFLVYAVFRANPNYTADFHHAAAELNTFIGALNTVVLLVSSATVAMSITALQKGKKYLSMALVGVTILMAAVFMLNKYFEWSHKFHYHIWPGSDVVSKMENGETLFYGLYYFMTGLHALHVLIGVVLMTVTIFRIKSGHVNAERISLLENSGLYWHLVDLIWIFLFPLLYLIT